MFQKFITKNLFNALDLFAQVVLTLISKSSAFAHFHLFLLSVKNITSILIKINHLLFLFLNL